MKVVLNQDVKGTGKRGEIVEVSDGYARNFLLPRKLGIEASAQNIHSAQKKAEADDFKNEQARKAALESAKGLQGQTIVMSAKAGEGGRLFGAITTKEIAAAVEEKFGIELDKKRIVLGENIKRVGDYEVELKPFANVSATIIVRVEAQE